MGPWGAAIIWAVPRRRPTTPGGRPLDPVRPEPDPARPKTDAPASLIAQLKATRAAVVRVLRAHVDLARAEFDEIKGEIGRALALGGLAFACVVLVAFLLPIGLFLFLGEWLFGSLGWGVLHGTELLLAVAVLAGLAAVRSSGIGVSIGIAFIAGLAVAILFGTNVLNTAYRAIGDLFGTTADPGDVAFAVGAGIGALVFGIVGVVIGARGGTAGGAVSGLVAGALAGALVGLVGAGLVRLAIDPGSRPMVVGIVIWGLVAGIAGLVAGRRSGGWRGALGIGAAALVAGGLFGAFTAITFTWHVAIAIGIAVLLALVPAVAGAFAARGGIDPEALKARYWPQATIETTKETIEWAKARIPGRRS